MNSFTALKARKSQGDHNKNTRIRYGKPKDKRIFTASTIDDTRHTEYLKIAQTGAMQALRYEAPNRLPATPVTT